MTVEDFTVENLISGENNLCYLICTLEKADGEEIILKDCTGIEKNSNRTIQKNYKTKYKNEIERSSATPVIWILVGTKNGGKKECVQVGRNSTRELMFKNDIFPDINAIRGANSKRKQYHGLMKKYDSVEFYEVNIDEYLKKYDIPLPVEITAENEHIRMFEQEKLAVWAEGMIAACLDVDEEFFNAVGMEKHSYNYYKKKQNTP